MEIKVRSGNVWCKVNMIVAPIKGVNRVFFSFPYNPSLLRWAKSMDEARWMPERKMWHAAISDRTDFRLDFGVQGRDNPYAKWRIPEADWPQIDNNRPYMDHQVRAIRQALSCGSMIWAQEMRTGKTLQGIKVMEEHDCEKIMWVGPRSALAGVRVDFRKWGTTLKCEFLTYEKLNNRIKNWNIKEIPPNGIVFDEIHSAKNPDTLRTHSVRQMIEGMRRSHESPPIIAMSGTLAPKNPVDWWSPVELICPGYIQESKLSHFQQRLGLVVDGTSAMGHYYPILRTWFDNPEKCQVCGLLENGYAHDEDIKLASTPKIHNTTFPANLKDKEAYKNPHKFISSINEVEKLGERLKGIVHVQYFKDCKMNLPEMETEYWYYNKGWHLTMDLAEVNIDPEESTKKIATQIVKMAPMAAVRDLRLRELSDGFQYNYTESDETETCPECKGEGECIQFDDDEDEVFDKCWKCDGTGTCFKVVRVGDRISTPKDDRLRDDLEQFEASSRIVIFTAFTESTDRVVELCIAEGWNIIRVDGRGWQYFGDYDFHSDDEALEAFANKDKYHKLAWIGHPRSGGMGVSLSASSCVIFYSNSDASNDKLQGRKRIHDLGMDVRRGAVIKEYFHMKADVEAIYRYLKKVDLYDKVAGGVI